MSERIPSLWTGREKFFLVTTIVFVIAAAVGFGLWRTSLVPEGSAAKVGDTYVTEADVATSIDQYRASYGLTDNTTFASALAQQGYDANSFRRKIIDDKATAILVDARAKELGLVPTDDEINAKYDSMKSGMSFGSDEIWQQTLEQYGMTEEALRDQVRIGLEKQALYEAEVERGTASDADALSYAQSQLAGVTQKHFYRIMFTGDDASARAHAARAELVSMRDGGTLSTETFSQKAREISDESDVAQTGGSYAWAVELSSDTDLSEVASSLSVGELSEVESVSAEAATVILYCDTSYTFPSSSDISSLKASDVPESLWTLVKDQASETLWQSQCAAYLSNLLMNGQVTYYPMPANASYNIPIAVSSSSDSASATASGSAAASASGSSSGTSASASATSGSASTSTR